MPADVLQFKLPIPQARGFQLVSPMDLRAGFWDIARPKLALVATKCGADWIPEDVYVQIVLGKYFMFACYEGEDLVGITVVKESVDDLTGKRSAFVFAAWYENWDEVKDEAIAFYDKITKDMKTDTIHFYSPREGWRGKDSGCKIAGIIWERKING